MTKLFSQKLTIAEQDAIIQKKLAWILAACSPRKILLIGSAATYEMTNGSDVDLLIIFDDSTELALAKENLFQSRPRDDWPHDLLFYTPQSFAKSVATGGGAAWLAAREGKILFGKDEEKS